MKVEAKTMFYWLREPSLEVWEINDYPGFISQFYLYLVL